MYSLFVANTSRHGEKNYCFISQTSLNDLTCKFRHSQHLLSSQSHFYFLPLSQLSSFLFFLDVHPQLSRAESRGSVCLHASWPEDIITGTA